MNASTIMTLRIDPDLHAALRERAQREGRSVSAEVVRMIRKELEAAPRRRPRKAMSTMGMFADFEAPAFSEFKRLRREVAAGVRRRVDGARRLSRARRSA